MLNLVNKEGFNESLFGYYEIFPLYSSATVQGQKFYLSKRCNMTIDRLLLCQPKNFPSIFMTINEKLLQNDEAEKTYTRIYNSFIVVLGRGGSTGRCALNMTF